MNCAPSLAAAVLLELALTFDEQVFATEAELQCAIFRKLSVGEAGSGLE